MIASLGLWRITDLTTGLVPFTLLPYLFCGPGYALRPRCFKSLLLALITHVSTHTLLASFLIHDSRGISIYIFHPNVMTKIFVILWINHMRFISYSIYMRYLLLQIKIGVLLNLLNRSSPPFYPALAVFLLFTRMVFFVCFFRDSYNVFRKLSFFLS